MKILCQDCYFADNLPGTQYAYIFGYGSQQFKVYDTDPKRWEVGKHYIMKIEEPGPDNGD